MTFLITCFTEPSCTDGEVIYVSGGPHNKDDSTCGTLSHPCATFAHALNISKDSDNILLDTSFEQVSDKAVEINKEISISSYVTDVAESNTTQKYGVLRFQNLDSPYDYDKPVFKISSNVSFSKLEIVHSTVMITFQLVNPCQQVTIKHCIFKIGCLPGNDEDRLDFLTLDSGEKQVTVVDTKIIGNRTTKHIFNSSKKYKSDNKHNNNNNSKINDNYNNKRNNNNKVRSHSGRGSDKPILGNITFDSCSFVNHSLIFGYGTLVVKNSTFNDFNVVIGIDESIFDGNNFIASSLTIRYGDSSIQNCHFHGTSLDYSEMFSHLFQLNIYFDDEINRFFNTDIVNCTFTKAIYGAVNLRNCITLLLGCKFLDNTIQVEPVMSLGRSGGVASYSGKLEIHNCEFINNSAPLNQPGAIYTMNNGGIRPTLAFALTNTTIVSGDYPDTSDNTVILTQPIGDRQGTAWIGMDETNLIYCQSNEFIHKKYFMFHYFKFHCKKCDGTRYNAHRSKFTNGSYYNMACYPCPYQATCFNGIRSKGNYWGISNSLGKVSFTICPASYCCSSNNKCTSYNTCETNRAGRLCGDCRDPYHVISLFGQGNKCVPKVECKNPTVLWVLFIACVLSMCSFVLYGADAFKLVYTQFAKLRKNKKNEHEIYKNEDQITAPSSSIAYKSIAGDDKVTDQIEEPLSIQPYCSDNDIKVKSSPPDTTKNFAGVVKTVFFFYQTASIIRVEASAKATYEMPGVISLLTSFFNIRFDDVTTEKGGVTKLCPFETSSVVLVEAFRSSVPLIGLFLFLISMIATRAATGLHHIRKQQLHHVEQREDSLQKPLLAPTETITNQPTTINEIETATTSPPNWGNRFMCRLKAGYVNLMLLGYSSMAILVARSIHCVRIGDESENGKHTFLFIQASIECYQPWQQIMVAVFVGWIAPFPVVLYAACRMLRSHRISPNQFLWVLTFPPACLVFLFRRCHHRSAKFDDDDGEGEDGNARWRILSVLNDPFRRNKNNNKALIWEPVLLGRRLLLIVMTTFILSPIMRLYPVALALLLFAVHDHLAKPYTSDNLNLAQFLSTLAMMMLLLLNMFWALTNNVDLTEDRTFCKLGELFIVVEVVILMLPVTVVLLYVALKIIKSIVDKIYEWYKEKIV